VTAALVAGVSLRVPREPDPYACRPLAAVARADGTLAHLVDRDAAAHLALVYCHPTRMAVDLDVLMLVRDWTLAQVAGAALVVLGSYGDPHGPKNPYLRAELQAAVRLGLHAAELPAAVVRPAMVGRYATGHAYGDTYQAACELFADQLAASDAAFLLAAVGARALWLRAMGADRLGIPLVERTSRQRAALREVAWPIPAERGEPR
jgi:hypothetical protein